MEYSDNWKREHGNGKPETEYSKFETRHGNTGARHRCNRYINRCFRRTDTKNSTLSNLFFDMLKATTLLKTKDRAEIESQKAKIRLADIAVSLTK